MTNSHWNFNPAGCACCQERSPAGAGTLGGGGICGRCRLNARHYRLTVGDVGVGSVNDGTFDPATYAGTHLLKKYKVFYGGVENGVIVDPPDDYDEFFYEPGSSGYIKIGSRLRPIETLYYYRHCHWYKTQTDTTALPVWDRRDGRPAIILSFLDANFITGGGLYSQFPASIWRLRWNNDPGWLIESWFPAVSGSFFGVTTIGQALAVRYRIPAGQSFQCAGTTVFERQFQVPLWDFPETVTIEAAGVIEVPERTGAPTPEI